QVGMGPKETRRVVEEFENTALGGFLAQIAGYNIDPHAFFSWTKDVENGEPSATITTAVDPNFSGGAFMLGCEEATRKLVRFINDLNSGTLYADLEIFIGSSLPGDTNWKPAEAQSELKATINMYERLKAAGNRPIDPERLVGVSKHVMSGLGLIPPI